MDVDLPVSKPQAAKRPATKDNRKPDLSRTPAARGEASELVLAPPTGVTTAPTGKVTSPKQKPAGNKREYGTRSKATLADASAEVRQNPMAITVEKAKTPPKQRSNPSSKPRAGGSKQTQAQTEVTQGKVKGKKEAMPLPKVRAHASPPTAQEVQDWFAANAPSTAALGGPVQVMPPPPRAAPVYGDARASVSTLSSSGLSSLSNGSTYASTVPNLPPATLPLKQNKGTVSHAYSKSKRGSSALGHDGSRMMLKRRRPNGPQVSFQHAASYYITKKQVPIHVVAAKLQIPKPTLLKYINGENMQRDHRYIETQLRNFLYQIGDFEQVTRNLKPFVRKVISNNRRTQPVGQRQQKDKSTRTENPRKLPSRRNGLGPGKAMSKSQGQTGSKAAFTASKSTKIAAGKKKSRNIRSPSEEYKEMTASFIKNWKLRAQGDAKAASSQKHKKALYEAAISAFDPASCNEGHRFAGEINRLCNLFNTNVDRMQTATAYGWVYDAVSQGLESIFNALDVRIAKASSVYEVFTAMKITEEASVSYTLFNGALSGWHSTLNQEFSCLLLCLWRKVLFRVHALHPDIYTSSLAVMRLCSWRLVNQMQKETKFAKEAREHIQVLQHWLQLLERQTG